MAVSTNWFDAWKRRPPPFLVQIITPTGVSGSGIQINAEHVVTCAHVLYPFGPKRFYDSPPNQRPDVTKHAANIRCSGFETTGSVIAQHEALDLVALQLARPRPGVVAPFLSKSEHLGEACVLGLSGNSDRFVSLIQSINVDTKSSSFRGATATQVRHEYGALEGTSGGGVFACEEGTLYFVGIPTLGGERSTTGAYIPADAVFDFLKDKLNFEQPRNPSNPYERHLWSAGIAPAWELKSLDSGLTLSFVAILHDALGASAACSFVSRSAISASQMRLRTPDRILPGHHRLPAWANQIEQAEAAIHRLEVIMGCKLRLPTPRELDSAWQTADSGRIPEGRPLALSDFTPNDRGIKVPPRGAIEWARDRDGNAFALERCDDVTSVRTKAVPVDQAGVRDPCFRVAFDVEGA